jgi:hypothetical protein
MTTLVIDDPTINQVSFSANHFSVVLNDGRTVSVPLAWFPRLLNATKKERQAYKLIGQGEGVSWPLLEEDISVESILSGRSSAETQKSLLKWFQGRKK